MATSTTKKKKAAVKKGKASGRKTAAKKSTAKKSTAKKPAAKKSAGTKKWSARVTQTSDALDLEKNVFKSTDPKKIAASVKRSAAKSKRKKSGTYQSAMSMLNFYENRAGKNLPAKQKKVLEKAKEELRKISGRAG